MQKAHSQMWPNLVAENDLSPVALLSSFHQQLVQLLPAHRTCTPVNCACVCVYCVYANVNLSLYTRTSRQWLPPLSLSPLLSLSLLTSATEQSLGGDGGVIGGHALQPLAEVAGLERRTLACAARQRQVQPDLRGGEQQRNHLTHYKSRTAGQQHRFNVLLHHVQIREHTTYIYMF